MDMKLAKHHALVYYAQYLSRCEWGMYTSMVGGFLWVYSTPAEPSDERI